MSAQPSRPRVAEMRVAWVLPMPSPAALRAVVADVRARFRRVTAPPARR